MRLGKELGVKARFVPVAVVTPNEDRRRLKLLAGPQLMDKVVDGALDCRNLDRRQARRRLVQLSSMATTCRCPPLGRPSA